MKIHGTAKGGAESKKDFGVAFSSGGGGVGCTYETDFSTNTGWTTQGANFTIDTTNNELDFKGERNGNNDAIGYDLTEVSDTEWNLRFKFIIDDINDADGAGIITCFGLRSQNQTNEADTAQDAIGYFTFNSNSAAESDFRSAFADNTYVYANAAEIGTNILAENTFYIEIKRTAEDEAIVTVTTNSDFSGGSSNTIAVTGIANLRYIVFSNQKNASSSDNYIAGRIQDLKFVNDTSTACS